MLGLNVGFLSGQAAYTPLDTRGNPLRTAFNEDLGNLAPQRRLSASEVLATTAIKEPLSESATCDEAPRLVPRSVTSRVIY